MAVQRSSRSGLFLLELMIVILFFAVTSAICMNLFVQAHLTSTAGSELTAAVREVQSAAELFKAADGDLKKLAESLGVQPIDGPVLNLYYDKDWVLTKHMEDAVYTVSVVLDEIMTPDWQGCQKAQVIARAEEAEIFRVPVKKYVG
ncbi:MAG: hypothetical protein HFK04_00850 [Oscillospiraceae bacterium]|nr:hypothetical protein [Oscillospiraceae bacterium]